MGCEEQHYHEIDTQSITKHPLILTFNSGSIGEENDKVIQANLSKNV